MSCDWPLKKVSDVAVFQNNKRVPLKSTDREKRQGIYPYYGASGVVDHIDDFIFDGNYLLISEDGENLRTRNTPIAFKVSGKFWVNNHAHILSEKEEGILDYLEAYFSVLNLNPYITGAAQPKLNKANLDSIEIPIPPIEDRLKINNVLNSLSDKITLNRQINQTLEAMAQALFKSWFVDFEPVKAKMSALAVGGSADDANLAAMSAISGKTTEQLLTLKTSNPDQYQQLYTTADLFPSEMVDSELGEIPKGWSIGVFKDVCQKVESGGTPSRSVDEYWNGDIKWLASGEVRDVIVLDTKEKITHEGLSNSSAKLWPPYSTVVAMYGATAGQVCLIANEMTSNQACCALIPNPEYKSFIFFAARNSIQSLADRASGSAQQNLNKGLVENHPLLIPSDAVALSYEKSVSVLLDAWIRNIEENSRLDALRDLMLPKLLAGELLVDGVSDDDAF